MSAKPSWPLVCRLPLGDDSVKELCRSVGPLVPTVAFRLAAEVARLVLDEGMRVVVTGAKHAHCIDHNLVGGAIGQEPVLRRATPDDPEADTVGACRWSASSKGMAQYTFDVEAIVSSILVSWKLRDTKHLESVARLIWRLTLPDATAQRLCDELRDGSMKLPKGGVVYLWQVKVDMSFSVWQQELCVRLKGVRFLMVDSSPQCGFNYLGAVETRIRRPANEDPTTIYLNSGIEALEAFFQRYFERHYLPLSAMGWGLADLTAKSEKLASSIRLKTGTRSAFE